MIGKTISHYKILEKLGEGGMGVVYKAEDIKLKRIVALKFLSPQILKNKEEKTRFLNEAHAAAAINHPHVTTIFEIDKHEDQTYISMEYVEGQTLKEKIAQRPLPITEVIKLSIQICEGLQQAHEEGIIHRDIKSANIMVTRKGQVKIMDFGLAKLRVGANDYSPSITKIGTTMGTAGYMSPEQSMGKEVDFRTDIWSLGIILYEMISGELPFKGDYEQALIYAILNEKPKPLTELRPETPTELWQLIEKSLAKEPDNRFQEVTGLLSGLESIKDRTVSEKGIHIRDTARKTSRLLLPTMIIVVILAILIGGYILFKGKPSTPEPISKTITQSSWKNSIAVLPFADLSSKKDQEYFCDGMTEDIITKLTHIQELKVISRTSVMRYKNTKKDIKQIGKELGVSTILEGSLRKEQDNIRVSAQLINIEDGFHLWAETFDRKLESIFKVQENISKSIAQALRLQFSPEILKTEKPEDIESYEYLLKASQLNTSYVITKQEEDFIKAKNLLNKALEIDPNNALTYSSLAWSHQQHYEITGNKEDPHQVEIHIKKAYQLNPDLAITNLGMAWLYYLKGDHQHTSQFLNKVTQLNPNSAEGNHVIGLILYRVGLEEKALKYLIKAIELNPLYVYTPVVLARCYMEMGAWEKAAIQYKKVLALDPDDAGYHLWYSYSLILLSQYQKAEQEVKIAEILDGQNPDIWSYRALLYAIKGEKELALRTMKEPYDKVYAQLGMKEEAFGALEQSMKKNPRVHSYLHLLNNPCYDKLRDDPRFQKILDQKKKIYQERQKIFKDL
ncbi:MAG: protein kinase [Thermodesulfovibrionales bacterium]|nr:protein kinase [Thermodesulfovibrionales bacterium]